MRVVVAAFALLALPALALNVPGTPVPPVDAPSPTETAALPHVAILPLRVEGLSENEVKRIAAILRARTETRGGFTIQSQETTDALADSAQALGIDCGLFEVDCVAQIGRVADVSFVIAGAATRLGDRVGIEMRLVHVESGGLRRQIAGLLPIEPDAQTAAAATLVEKFFDAEQKLGQIDLEVTPKDALVVLDGVRRGRAPLSLGNLAPGEHELMIGDEGFVFHKERVTVGADVVRKVVILVENKAGRPPPPSDGELAAPFIVAGAGALVAVAGVVTAVIGIQPLLALTSAESKLDTLDVNDSTYAATAAATYGARDAAANEWNTTGQWLTWGGSAAVVLGGAAIAAGVAWGSAGLAGTAE